MSNFAAKMCGVHGPSRVKTFWWCFGLFAFGRRNHIGLSNLTNEQFLLNSLRNSNKVQPHFCIT